MAGPLGPPDMAGPLGPPDMAGPAAVALRRRELVSGAANKSKSLLFLLFSFVMVYSFF
jgi:hypothetical protein